MTLVVCAVATLAALAAPLVAWRWWLDARAADRSAQRAHELEVHRTRVEVDMKAISEDRARMRQFDERLKTLEYRPPR